MKQQQIQKRQKIKVIGGYELGKRIGTGTFAIVRQAIHIKTQQKVAVKILRKKLIVDTRDKINISRELRIIQKLRHPNIVQLLQILENNSKIYLIMEHVQGGQLYQMIVKSEKNRLDEDITRIFFQQLISTVQYLHLLGITHRDIKPENILVANNRTMKLIDFGLSNLYQDKERLSTACGSPCYAAPEMLAQKSYDPLKVDLWSCGIVLYTMLVGYLPFEHQNTAQLYKLINKGDYDEPSQLTHQARDIVRRLLQVSPDKRLTIAEIRAHPFCSRRPQPVMVGLFPNEKIQIDLDIIQQMKDLGYSGFIKDLESNVLNQGTAAFYLVLHKKYMGSPIPYYTKIIENKIKFRTKSNVAIRYQQKNPEQLPLILKKMIKSSNNLNKLQCSQIIIQIRKKRQSSSKIAKPILIKRSLK